MRISIASNIRSVKRWTEDFYQRQIPFATQVAINDLAFQVLDAETDMLAHVFPKAGRWTKTAAQVEKKATNKRNPFAIVSIRKGREYLEPYETGGLHKLLPSKVGGTLLNPKDIQLNAAGQIKAGQLASLMQRSDVFAGEVHGIRGIWQRLPKGKALSKRAQGLGLKQVSVRLLIAFGNALPVKKRIQFYKVAQLTVRGSAQMALRKAMHLAVRTAR